jgi:hypothetical protein
MSPGIGNGPWQWRPPVFESLKQHFRKKPIPAPAPAPELVGSATSAKIASVPRVGERFPTVRHLAVNLVISPPDRETEPTMNGRSFGPAAIAYFEFRCKNVECAGGGFDITDSIERAIADGETVVSGRRVCRGWHGKKHVNQLRCSYELNFRVNIAYRA